MLTSMDDLTRLATASRPENLGLQWLRALRAPRRQHDR